jgi:hypothetical protein
MKQTISILLCLVLAISILAFSTFADETAGVDTEQNTTLDSQTDVQPVHIAAESAQVESNREKMMNNKANRTAMVSEFAKKMHEKIAGIQAKLNENMQQKIDSIQDSNLSDEQKAKMMEHFEKFGNWSADKLQKLDSITMYKLRNVEQNKLDKMKNLSTDEVEKFMKLDRDTQKKILELNKDKIKVRLAQFELKKAQKKEDLFLKRHVTQEQVNQFKQMYKDNKDAFDADKAELKKLRDEFVKSMKDGNNSLEAAKEYVSKAIDLIVKELNMMSSKVQENDDLTSAEVSNITANIDAKITELNAVKEKVLEAKTKEDLKAAVKDIDNKWKIIKNHIELIQQKVKESKIGEVIVRSNYLETRLNNILSKMEEKGIDTTAVDAKVADFSAKVASARDNYAQAKTLIETVMNKKLENATVDISADKKQIQDLMTAAHNDLNDAHVILVDIAKTLKANGESIESNESDNEQAEVVVQTDSDNDDNETVDVEADDGGNTTSEEEA